MPGSKSPGLAGVLSAFIFPGTGSFYAGNEGHGIRHVVIGGVSLLGAAASAGDCDIVFHSGSKNAIGLRLVRFGL
ncbi:MAG: hypothetical protein ACE5HF_07485 [Gemmatimonadota bacterium]